MRRIIRSPLLFVWLVLTTFLLSACGNDDNARSLVLSEVSIPTTRASLAPTPTPGGAPKSTPTTVITTRPISTVPVSTIVSDLVGNFNNMPAVANTKDLKTTTGYVYYQINGATPGDLRAQMNQLGPTDSTGRRFDARTDWYINWQYSYEATNIECKIATVEVDVAVTFTLPHWNQPGNISPGLVDKWDKYMTALQIHEDGHKDNALTSGQEILEAFKALPAYPDCNQVKQNISTTGQRIIKQANQRDLDYDAQTKHGATQGATFP